VDVLRTKCTCKIVVKTQNFKWRRIKQVGVDPRTSDLNMTLPTARACAAFIDRSICAARARAQQQTSCTSLLLSFDGTDRRKDTIPLRYVTGSVSRPGTFSLHLSVPVPVLIPSVVTSRPTTASRPSSPLNPLLLRLRFGFC